jgi:hypothetical protein
VSRHIAGSAHTVVPTETKQFKVEDDVSYAEALKNF